MSPILNSLGAVITAGLGVIALVNPMAAAKFTSMLPDGLLGISEIRATYGGFFFAAGAWALYSQDPVVFQVLGIAWLGAAGGRILSIVVDKSREAKNFGGVVFEGVIGLLCIL